MFIPNNIDTFGISFETVYVAWHGVIRLDVIIIQHSINSQFVGQDMVILGVSMKKNTI